MSRARKEHISLLATKDALAAAYIEDGRLDDAQTLLKYVVDVQERTLDANDETRLRSVERLAVVYALSKDAKKVQAAIGLLEDVFYLRNPILGKAADSAQLESGERLAIMYVQTGQVELAIMAVAILELVVATRARASEEDDAARLQSEERLAMAYVQTGEVELVKRAVAILEHVVDFDKDDPICLESDERLAMAYTNTKENTEVEKAFTILKNVVRSRARTLHEADPTRLESEARLASKRI